MLSFIRDSFMISYKWLNPVAVDALDMDNGLVSLLYGVACIGAHHTVRRERGREIPRSSQAAAWPGEAGHS